MHRKEVERTMKYEKPIWELIEFEVDDVICQSPGGLEPGLGDGDDF